MLISEKLALLLDNVNKRFIFFKQGRINKLVMSNDEQTSRVQRSYLCVKVQYNLVTTRAYRVTLGHD
jgi:hypothetical protein